MALIILPKNTGAQAVAEAQAKFKAAIDDLLTVVAIVYGEDEHTPPILEVCSARAATKSPIRRVMWVPDPSVLSEEMKTKYRKQKRPVVFVGLDDKATESLSAARAKVRIYVEEAYLRAEGQGGA